MCKTMVTGKRGTVKQNYRISRIMPLTESQRTLMRWLLDFCDSLEFSGSEEASYNYANDRAGWQLGRLWSGNDPQCARRWRSSEQVERPYEPWSEDYSDAEPAWRREDWIGA